MRVEVITGPAMSGKTTKLRAIQEQLKRDGFNAPLLVGTELQSPHALVRAVSEEIESGHKVVLADDCTLDQILAVNTLRKVNYSDSTTQDVVVHLAQQA